MTQDRVIEILTSTAHSIELNANDIFYPASLSVDMDIDDLGIYLDCYERYGYEGFLAFMSIILEQDQIAIEQDEIVSKRVEPMGNVKYNRAKYEEAREYLKDWQPWTW